MSPNVATILQIAKTSPDANAADDAVRLLRVIGPPACVAPLLSMVGYPHPIKGQGIYAYVTPMVGVTPDEELRKELMALVTKEISAIARPDLIQWAPGLPKTRSGKIMRRILRKIAANELDNLGDTTTLADPAVVQNLIEHRLSK